MDFVELLVPTNLFRALTAHVVPAVVVFCVFLGVALIRMDSKEPLLAQLDLLARALVEINHVVVRFTPLGVFAVAASAAGTMTIAEFECVQAYFADLHGRGPGTVLLAVTDRWSNCACPVTCSNCSSRRVCTAGALATCSVSCTC